MINRIIKKASKIEAAYRLKKMALLPERERFVSFTFDDFPISAIKNGARLLETKNAHGTFYSSFGLAGTTTDSGVIGSLDEMLDIANQGHELACHTFGHLDCSNVNIIDLIEDCNLNRENALEKKNIYLTSFAYPFGNYNYAAKKVIIDSYKSIRTVESGLNKNKVDLSALRSIALYESSGIDKAKYWIKKLNKTGGWLVFYTHDVDDSPSRFGCSVNLFNQVLELCVAERIKIMTVADVTRLCQLI